MNKSILIAISAVVILSAPVKGSVDAASEQLIGQKVPLKASKETTTVTVTIVKIDYKAGTVVLKDKNGKVYEFTVTRTSGIDLRKYKVGDVVQATIANVATSCSTLTRARISKTELLRLQ